MRFEVIPVIPTDKVHGCEECKHTGLVHMIKGKEHRYAYCLCPRGVALGVVDMHRKNKSMRTKEFMERKNWRVFKL
jgi:hypothetical protein